MYVMYVDEAGDLAGLSDPPRANDQPVFMLTGLILHWDSIRPFTAEFLALKRRFYPRLRHPDLRLHLDWILPEMKGADLRRNAMSGSRNERRHAQMFVNRVLALIERYEGKLLCRIWVKAPGRAMGARSVYAYSVQDLLSSFDRFLAVVDARGICVADARTKQLNEPIAHAVFTQLHSVGAHYQHLKEVPLFGHSGNHAGLQTSDLLGSGLLMPIACYVYCKGFVNNVHVNPRATDLRTLFGQRIHALQFRYLSEGRMKGGVTTNDPVNNASATLMFYD